MRFFKKGELLSLEHNYDYYLKTKEFLELHA